MSQSTLITGGSGFIGSHYVRTALARGEKITVLTRQPLRALKQLGEHPKLTLISSIEEIGESQRFDRLLNLAGQPLAEGRWSKRRKAEFYRSRVSLTEQLVDQFSQLGYAPATVVSGSAIGYYGHGDKPLDEDGQSADGFSHQLCDAWEQAALGFEDLGARVVWLRTGIVLGEQGALAKMLPAFKLGGGGPIGSGQQWMSWVHIKDMVGLIEHAFNSPELSRALNATAPHAVTNRDFAKALGAALHRPALLPMPALAVKLLFGEMGVELLLNGQNIVPSKALQTGYKFHYSELPEALASLL